MVNLQSFNKKIQTNIKPDISIIIPVYQEEKIISDTIRIYSQSLKSKYNFEIIISDGGSTDSTVSNIKGLADKIVVHNENRRQTISEGRNKGAEVAEGDILFFINADSYPKDIEYILKKISGWEKNELKNIDAISCFVLPFPDQTNKKDKFFYLLMNKYFKFLNMIGIGMGRGECQILKKEVFNKVKGYNPKIVAGEDFDLYRRIAKIGKVSFRNDFVIYESPRRFKEEGYISTLFKWFLNSLFVLLKGKSFSKEWKAIR